MTSQNVGMLLIAVAVLDLAAGFLLVVPRISDPRARGTLRLAFAASALTLGLLGAAFLVGVASLPGNPG